MAGGFDTYSATPASNTTINGISIAEGCPASGVNDALRQLAADGRTCVNAVQNNTYCYAGTSSGAANVYAATASPVPTLTAGMRSDFVSHQTNTGACTYNLNALGAAAIRKGNAGATALSAGDILTGATVSVIYNGTFWLLTGSTNLGQALVGEVKAYAGSSAPAGWVLCYGQNVSRTTYAALFAVASTTYGSGDGSTTFGLPDLRGRTLAGKDDMGGVAASRLTAGTSGITATNLGAAGGDQLLHAHSHTQQGTFTSSTVSADHTHTQAGTFASGGYSADHSHSYTTTGGGQNFNASGADTFAVTGGSGASTGGSSSNHTHNTTISGQTGGISANHTHSTTISGATTTSGTGAAQNVQPTLVLNFLIFAGV